LLWLTTHAKCCYIQEKNPSGLDLPVTPLPVNSVMTRSPEATETTIQKAKAQDSAATSTDCEPLRRTPSVRRGRNEHFEFTVIG
jgi:hypothetical protein